MSNEKKSSIEWIIIIFAFISLWTFIIALKNNNNKPIVITTNKTKELYQTLADVQKMSEAEVAAMTGDEKYQKICKKLIDGFVKIE